MTITIDAAAFASVLDALPARLRKRLDRSVERAAGWARESSADGASVLVRVDAETAVTVLVTAGVVVSAQDITCGCLLAPACLHRAAVASTLPLHDPADRRLGGGSATQAVRTGGVEWSQEPVAGLFHQPLSGQFARALAADSDDESFRAGDDLVFLRGRVLGLDPLGLVIGLAEPDDAVPGDAGVVAASDARVVRCALPQDSGVYQRNFALLGEVRPLVLLVARPDRGRPATVHALAVAVEPDDAAALALPEEWCGRVNLGIDRIPRLEDEQWPEPAVTGSGPLRESASGMSTETGGSASSAEADGTASSAEPVSAPAPTESASARIPTNDATSLHLLRHHVEHAASAGRAITRTALLERDCARLDAEAMHVAASLLRELVAQATPVRDVFARLVDTDSHPKDGYALAWLAAAVYEHAAAAELAVRQWSRAMG